MATENNTLINTFTKGMNSDVSYSMIDPNTYTFALNMRIVTLSETNAQYLNNQQGEVRPIEGVRVAFNDLLTLDNKPVYVNKILYAGNIREYGVIIFSDVPNDEGYAHWYIARFKNVGTPKLDDFYEINDVKIIFGPSSTLTNCDKFSCVLRYEDVDNIKLYVADNIHPILSFNIAEENDQYNHDLYGKTENTLAYPLIRFNKPVFNGIISGLLKPGLVQYSYSIYNKNGVTSEMSVPTKLIPIVNYINNTDGKTIKGVISDKNTSTGIKLLFSIDSEFSFMDRMRIYRIQYIESGQQPIIDLIYDGNWVYNYSDTGQSSLELLSLEEYNSLSGIHIIPKVIESKNDYLFAANIKTLQSLINNFNTFDARAFLYEKYHDHKDGSNNPNRADILLYDNIGEYTSGETPFNYQSPSDVSLNLQEYGTQESDLFNSYNDINTNEPNTYACKFTEPVDSNGTQYYGGTGINISWRFVVAELFGDTTPYVKYEVEKNDAQGRDEYHATYPRVGSTGTYISYKKFKDKVFTNKINVAYIKSDGTLEKVNNAADFSKYFISTGNTNTYADVEASTFLKSLRRNELYRYGIVLYDNNGQPSPVKWIADIRTPLCTERGFEPFLAGYEGVNLVVRPLGIEFNVNIPDDIKSEVSSYEIVRCKRNIEDIATVSQGVISRPLINVYHNNYKGQRLSIYTPSGMLTTANIWYGFNKNASTNVEDDGHEATNFFNDSLFLFISPEVSYQKEYVLSLMNLFEYTLLSLLYLFGFNGNFNIDSGTITSDEFSGKLYTSPIGCNNLNTLLYGRNGYVSDNVYILNDHLTLKNSGSLNNMLQYYDPFPIPTVETGDVRKINSNISTKSPDGKTFLPYTLWHIMTDRMFAYVKLYESNNTVMSVNSGNTDTRNRYAGTFNAYSESKINNAVMSDDLSWNSFLSKGDNGDPTGINAMNHVSSIGNKLYINWMFSGTMGLTPNDYRDLILDGNNNVFSNNNSMRKPLTLMMGPAGTCMLLDISQPTNYIFGLNAMSTKLFSDTIGTSGAFKSIFADSPFSNVMPLAVHSENGNPSGAINYKNATIADIAISNINTNCWFNIDENGIIQENTIFDKTSLDYSLKDLTQYQGGRYIYRPSISGTYLCNLRKNCTPYGGYDFQSRKLNTYTSYGDIYDSSETRATVFNGDCYIQPMDYVSLHKWYDSWLKYTITTMIGYAIPVESNINLAYTSGNEFSRNVDNSMISNLQIEPSNVYNKYIQDTPLYQYNTAYSISDGSKLYSATDVVDVNKSDEEVVDYRCYYSNVKNNNENIDSWTKFLAANYIDVDSKYGCITNLRNFKDHLVFWQERAVGIFSVKERSLIQDDSNRSLILGESGVLDRYDYIDDTSGMIEQQFADTKSDSSLYWFDDADQELKLYTGGNLVLQLSKIKGVQNIMHKYADVDKNQHTLFFDNKYNEVVSNVLKGLSIAYSEPIQAFTSVYDIPFLSKIQFQNKTYLLHTYNGNLEIGQWNQVSEERRPHTWDDVRLTTVLEYVVNKFPYTTKVFDNQEIVTVNKPFDHEKYDDENEAGRFTYNYKYEWNTDLNSTYSWDLHMTDREDNYRYAIPRVIDVVTGKEQPYGGRIRGKYMVTRMTDNNNHYDTSISYIITKFRTSWS